MAGRGVAAPSAVAALQREYVLRSALHERWSAVPQAIVSHGGGAVLVLRIRAGCRYPSQMSRSRGYPRFCGVRFRSRLRWARCMAGIVHRALAPHRFLVDDDDRAFLTGFGYAIGPDVTEPLCDTGLEWDDADFVYTAPELGTRMICVSTRAPIFTRSDAFSMSS